MFLFQQDAIVGAFIHNCVPVVFEPAVFEKNFEEVIEEINSAVLETESVFVLIVDLHIVSQVSSGVNFNLQRVYYCRSHLSQCSTLFVVP